MKMLLLIVLVAAGCRSSRGNDTLPFVQPSADSPATRTVTITRLGNFSPPCLSVDLGETVEWDNPTTRSINVTSGSVRGMPPELYSPSLVAQAAQWRHRFEHAGRFDYFDQGGAGAGAVDPYYGTRTGASTAGAIGTLCVRNPDGSGCDSLCCARGRGVDQCLSHLCQVSDDPQIGFGFCAAGAAAVPLDASTSD